MMTDITGIKGDLYQTSVIMKYELIKHFRSKKMYIFLVLLAVILGLTLAVCIGWGFPAHSEGFMSISVMTCVFVVLVAAILFAATALVSEFEERTALLIFTRPVRKITILFGKFLASALITSVMIAIYFAIFGVICQIEYGEIPGSIVSAIGVAIAAGLCYVGMAFLLSSFAKKGSTASILTLIVNLVIISLVSGLITVATNGDMILWFMPDFSLGALYTALDLNAFNGITGDSIAKVGTSIGVLLAWCFGTLAASYAIFRKREF